MFKQMHATRNDRFPSKEFYSDIATFLTDTQARLGADGMRDIEQPVPDVPWLLQRAWNDWQDKGNKELHGICVTRCTWVSKETDPRGVGDALGEEVSTALEAFFARALSREPKDRFRTALQASAAWRQLQ